MSPEVSVIIPAYNHEAFVSDAVDSVLATTSVDLELVVVDDGSTDGTRDRLETYRGDPRVRLHFQDNRGAHDALNRGLELARGELVFILDSDDIFEPGRIETLATRLGTEPAAALAASWIRVVDASDAELGVKRAWRTLPPWEPPHPGPRLSDLADPVLALLETNWISTTSNLAFPARLVRKHGLRFSNLRYAHDWDFILSLCRHGTVELVEDPLLRYRVHGANTIGEGTDDSRGVMRFEIMWVVARHAAAILHASTTRETERAHLRRLLLSSAPSFGNDALLEQLLLLRGTDELPPAAYDALLAPDNPYRRAGAEALQH